MPTVGLIKRAALIKALKKAGFTGPYPGGKHEFLVRGELRLSYLIHTRAKSAGSC